MGFLKSFTRCEKFFIIGEKSDDLIFCQEKEKSNVYP